jgi:serine/threonine protein kinase
MTGEQFALKLFTPAALSRDQRSLLREMETLMQVRHPAVLPLVGLSFSWSAENPFPAILTPYLPSGSLEDVIAKKRRLSAIQKMIVLFGISAAMDWLHEEARIVHRDLKPANVLLNSRLEPVVADFGLAKHVTADQMRQTAMAGSPVYMAPELVRGQEYSVKVDVYAFGILAFELLTTSMAFMSFSNGQELGAQTVKGLRPPEGEIPEKLRDLVVQCWADKPTDRPTFRSILEWLGKAENWWEQSVGVRPDAFNEYVAKLRPYIRKR